MSIETLQQAHKHTQSKIEGPARERHFHSGGRWEEEKTLVQTIYDIEDRLTTIEITLKGISEYVTQCQRNSDDTRSNDNHERGSDETPISRLESSRIYSEPLYVAKQSDVRSKDGGNV